MEVEEIYRNIGQNIKKYRNMRGISQEKLAEKIGVNDKYIGSAERSEKRAGLKTLIKIANALEIKLECLFKFD